jgi:hypothetical protein
LPSSASASASASAPAPASIIIPIGLNEQSQFSEAFPTLGTNSTNKTKSSSTSLQYYTNQVTADISHENSSKQQRTPQSDILPYTLYRMYYDEENLSEYQCLIRRHMELFEATTIDVCSNAQGRHKIITLGQIGIRCRHCSDLLPRSRLRGSTYYPSSLHGLYQAAQNMATIHFGNFCHIIPDPLRLEFQKSRGRMKSKIRGGRDYWANCLRIIGITEVDGQLRYQQKK